MSFPLTFGDVFEYEERVYIFLVLSEKVIHVARVLDLIETQKIEERVERLIQQGKDDFLKTNVLFAYVKLQTKELKNRACHLHNTGKDDLSMYFSPLPISLSNKDLKGIKKEILERKTVSTTLQELVKDIEI
ncbi:hypothetical protein KKE34_01025 [Patescibacteria group bacterium]|nr:hypothetical protein [Patescibacteria group bacterium]MBU1885173.1 hypothetical protein [Patescibacteria group bacterium]